MCSLQGFEPPKAALEEMLGHLSEEIWSELATLRVSHKAHHKRVTQSRSATTKYSTRKLQKVVRRHLDSKVTDSGDLELVNNIIYNVQDTTQRTMASITIDTSMSLRAQIKGTSI